MMDVLQLVVFGGLGYLTVNKVIIPMDQRRIKRMKDRIKGSC